MGGEPRPTTEEQEALQDFLTYGTPATFGLKRHEDIKMASGGRVPQDLPAPVDLASRALWMAGAITTGPHGHTGGILTYEMTKHYPLFRAPTSRQWWAQKDLATKFPEFVALDDVCVYAVCKLLHHKERARKFGADFDGAGDIRSQRPTCGNPPGVLYKGEEYYLLSGKHYVLKGDHDVKIPSSVKLISLNEGRKAAKADNSPCSFGAVKVPAKIPRKLRRNIHAKNVCRLDRT